MTKKPLKAILFFFVFCLVGAGLFYFFNTYDGQIKAFTDREKNSLIVHSFTDKKGNSIITHFSPNKESQKFKEITTSIEKKKTENEKPKSRGYIVQFKEEPLVVKQQEFQKKNENNQFEIYRSNFDSKFSSHKSQLKKLIPGFDKKIRKEFKNIFTGISLDISEKEVKKIKKLNFVENVYPNYEVKALLQDTIPLINANDVWEEYTGAGMNIAIIDTGIDYTHLDLGGCTKQQFLLRDCSKVRDGYDFANNDLDPMDDHGHGTHVAGIAAGKKDDGDNIYEPLEGEIWGVAPDAKLFAYKVLDAFGSGYWDWVIAGIDRAAEQGVDVINLSLGGWGDPDDPVSQAVDNAVDVGIVAVVAAGNSGFGGYQTISSPATARKAITVGASDKTDKIADFSSRGPVIWDNKILIKPDVVAPGVDVTSTVPAGECELCDPSGYNNLSGTSMAAPHVAGAVALIKQAHPDWTPQEIKMALRNAAVKLVDDESVEYDVLTQGYGRIDVSSAIEFSVAPPIAELINVSYGVSGAINIFGTATGTDFESYSLYYGAGHKPDSWDLVCSSNVPVSEGVLCSDFDTSLISDGRYSLKLVVDANEQNSEDRSLIFINNLELTHPLNNDIFRAGDVLEIKGNIVKGESFQDYVIEYGLGEDPVQWSNSGINLIDNDDILATWNTSSINQADFYTLRLTANYAGNIKTYEFVRNIYLDPTLKEGWPKRIEWDYGYDEIWDEWGYFWPGYVEPVISDINNDGFQEIIVYAGGKPPKLYVFKSDGSFLSGWPKEVGDQGVAGGDLHIPLVGDINNDGFDEIIAYTISSEGEIADWSATLYAFNYNGSVLWSSKILTGEDTDFEPTMLMADLNLDGNKEIVVKGNDAWQEKMVIINNEGEILFQWDLPNSTWSAGIASTPAIGNFDGDLELEIVSVSPTENAGYDWENEKLINEGAIYIYNMNGSVVSGWPVLVPGEPFSSPAVGDINNDGELEIVVGLLYDSDLYPDERYGGLYAFDKSGNILSGWPFMKGYKFWSSPSLADFDRDGDLEIVASRIGFETYVLHHDGTIVSGWPKTTCWNDYYSTIIGDIDDDGALDILTTAGNGIYGDCQGSGGVYAWKFDGTSIEGFSKLTEVDAQAPATVADIDNDGKVELVASSDWDSDLITGNFKYRSTIYVWELNTDYSRETMRWPMFHHDSQQSGLYGATGLTTTLISVGEDTDVPYYINDATPAIVAAGKTNMLCRWGNADVVYSAMSDANECAIVNSNASCNLTNQGADGEKKVYISCQDIFGNEQSAHQNLDITFILDTTPPAAPTINPVRTPTYDSTQTISGTKEAYTSVWLNGIKIIDLNAQTTWSYTISLSIGENPISITLKDLALNESQVAAASITRKIRPSGGGGGSGGGGRSSEASSPSVVIGETIITPAKGGEIAIASPEGAKISVNIPPAAVEAETKLTITPVRITQAPVGLPPFGNSIVGGYLYKFSATLKEKTVTTFTKPVTLTFTYTDNQIVGLDELSLTINYWDETAKKWIGLETKTDPVNNTITTKTTHFTYFAIIGKQLTKEEVEKEKLIAEIKTKIAQIQALILQLQQLLKQRIIADIPAGFKFTNPLSFRDRHIEVRYLQIFLKAQGPEIYPEGAINGYFDYATLKAVKRFQLKYGIITPETSSNIAGYVGPATRAKINEILGR